MRFITLISLSHLKDPKKGEIGSTHCSSMLKIPGMHKSHYKRNVICAYITATTLTLRQDITEPRIYG